MAARRRQEREPHEWLRPGVEVILARPWRYVVPRTRARVTEIRWHGQGPSMAGEVDLLVGVNLPNGGDLFRVGIPDLMRHWRPILRPRWVVPNAVCRLRQDMPMGHGYFSAGTECYISSLNGTDAATVMFGEGAHVMDAYALEVYLEPMPEEGEETPDVLWEGDETPAPVRPAAVEEATSIGAYDHLLGDDHG